jgi:phosphoketolase
MLSDLMSVACEVGEGEAEGEGATERWAARTWLQVRGE